MSFFRAAYRLYLYSIRQHGVILGFGKRVGGVEVKEYVVRVLHFIPLLLITLSLAFYLCCYSLLRILYCGYKGS